MRALRTRTWTSGLLVACIVALVSGCAGNLGPNVTPVGQTAHVADRVITSASTALDTIERLTDQGIIPKPVTVRVAANVQKVGEAGKLLAQALKVYQSNANAESWRSVQGALTALQGLLRDALNLEGLPIDEATRQRIQGIAQPIFAAVLEIALLLQPPAPA